jgi:hypothetical protein
MTEWRKLPWWIIALILLGALVGAFLLLRGLWLSFQFGLWSIAESLAQELAIYIPLNQGYLTALTFFLFVALIPLATLVLSLKKRNRMAGVMAGGLGLAIFYAVIGYASSSFLVDPLSGAPTKCYSIFNGKITYRDLVPGQERRFDPETGRPCVPITPEIAGKLKLYEYSIVPNRIPEDVAVEPDMFDRALGTPLVWYYRSADGAVELFDNEGFHPETSVPLKPVTLDVIQEWRAQRARLLDEKKKSEAERQRNEELRREQERQALIDQQRQESERRQAADDCDRLAGNVFDGNRNRQFPGVPYQLLAVNASAAVKACQFASGQYSTVLRYRYQLGRALQATGSPEARQVMTGLVQTNYPAAFDNLGWLLIREKRVDQAIGLFQQGSRLGNAEAMVSLAGFLLEGKWVEKNEQEAMRLLSSAAALGHAQAQQAVTKYEERKKMGALMLGVVGSALLEILKK